MKKTTEKATTRETRDALCKRLAEDYPEQFARWLFDVRGKVKVEKTELDREPIRADAVIFSSDHNETLHGEFQTTQKSDVPLPLRFLDYYVGLKRKHPARRVRQVLVVLTPTEMTVPDHYEDERTWHGYDVVKMWEQDPAELLQYEGLLPLATLCRAEAGGEKLLQDVAAQINRIKSREQRREALNWSRVLAGLRYNKHLIFETLKESDMLEESVIYQDIFKKGQKRGRQEGVAEGEQRGLQQGMQQGMRLGEKTIAQRLLARRFGKMSNAVLRQVDRLTVEQLESLCEALLDFKTKEDLTRWLKQHAAAR